MTLKLVHAHISNFKLLEDVELEFSTDPARPLTALRAENGSGKTSLLQALRWGIWGSEAIPSYTRLTSSEKPANIPVNVQVTLEFQESDPHSSETAHYRLITTCQETPGENNSHYRGEPNRMLYRLTPEGAEPVQGVDGQIHAMFPFNLSNIFFTDGDAVQNFISNTGQSDLVRQDRVHQAIREVLGLPAVEKANTLLTSAVDKYRRAARNTGSVDLRSSNDQMDRTNQDLKNKENQMTEVDKNLRIQDDYIREDERELGQIKGIGDLDEIQERIHNTNTEIQALEQDEKDIRNAMRELLESEELAIHYLKARLQPGTDALKTLADLNVIPGISAGVLEDRLELGICICGENLSPGNTHHQHVSELIQEQRNTEAQKERLTALNHEARRFQRMADSSEDDDDPLKNKVNTLKERLASCRDRSMQKDHDLKALEDRRGRIDAERVQILTDRIRENQAQKDQCNQQKGILRQEIQELEGKKSSLQKEIDRLTERESLDATAKRRQKVAEDLYVLCSGILGHLTSDKVQQVSDAMNELFLNIVGADTTAQANLFAGVHIADNFNIIITTQAGRQLDPDTELNGASQRALTLSLIWTLMEVTGRESPRIIDTPLGMTSGSVKNRMVDLLTAPVTMDKPPYQVILFMTRSEIRDIEQLLEERTGKAATLSCSKDYPKDLTNNWGTQQPVIRVCDCNHAQYCSACQRHNDRTRLAKRETVEL